MSSPRRSAFSASSDGQALGVNIWPSANWPGAKSWDGAMPLQSIPGFSDPFASLSHLLGAVIFLAMSFFLVRRGAGSTARVVSLAIFSFGAIFLLSISGTYHLLDPD